MDGIIDIIGFTACAILIYAWIEPKIGRRRRRERKTDAEMRLKATRDLIQAINERTPRIRK